MAIRGGFLKDNFFITVVFLAYVQACLGPLWGLGFESPGLVAWSASVALILAVSLWRFIRPVRKFPSTDIALITSLMLSVNLFSAALGPDRGWLQPMYFLIIVLCSLFYSIGFNFAMAGLVFLLEGANALSGGADARSAVGMVVFGAYLAVAVLVLGRLFKAEHSKKEKAIQAVRRLQEGAMSIGEHDTISPEGRLGHLVESAAGLDRMLSDVLDALRGAVPCDNALLFMAHSGEDGVYLRVHQGDGAVHEDASVQAGQGLVGWVAREKAPLLVSGNARGLAYLKKEDGTRSFIAAPVLNGSFLEGVLALDSVREDAFKEQDKETLARFARIMIYLLQNARAYEKVDMSAKNFSALHRISAEVSSSLDIETIVDKLALTTSEILPYDFMTVSLVEADGTAIFRKAVGYDDGGGRAEGPVPLAGSLLGWIVENRQPLCFTEMDSRTEKLPIFPAGLFKADCRSFLGIPLMSQDKVMGVFTVALRRSGGISAYQQHMLSVIANQVAVNIANAKLHLMMQHMATVDGLTGLINHRHFQEKADEEFVRAGRYPESLSLLLMDIDHFKKVNDTYGHPVGDAVLKKVAKILKQTVRSVDIAARYGGEEFVVLMINTGSKGAHQMAERIRGTVEKGRFTLGGMDVPVTISVGHATYPEDAAGKKELFEKADQALYWAKGHGRNQTWDYKAIVTAGKKA